MEFKATLLDEKALGRMITRIAHEISERNDDLSEVILVGVKTRGIPFAKRISECIRTKIDDSINVPVGELDITDFRDDKTGGDRKRYPGELPCDINKKTVILTDDVIYTGRTARAALDAIISIGRPNKVQLAVLVDRGHRELPIRPDFVGKNIPTSKNEIIKVGLTETDGKDVIEIYDK